MIVTHEEMQTLAHTIHSSYYLNIIAVNGNKKNCPLETIANDFNIAVSSKQLQHTIL